MHHQSCCMPLVTQIHPGTMCEGTIRVHLITRKSSRSSCNTTHLRAQYPLLLFPLHPPLGRNSDVLKKKKKKKGTLLTEVWGDSILILHKNITQQTSFLSTQSAQQMSSLHYPFPHPLESRMLVIPTLPPSLCPPSQNQLSTQLDLSVSEAEPCRL